jgi:hypothetical protein
MQDTQGTPPVQGLPRSRHTILRDCGTLAIVALLCWGLEGVVSAATVLWGPDWNTSAVDVRNRVEWLYLFAAPGVLLLTIVLRLLSVGLGKASSLLIAINIGWCVAIVIANIIA